MNYDKYTKEQLIELLKIDDEGCINLKKEIERLNNIINELEKELNKDFNVYICKARSTCKSIELGYQICQKETLNKLKELKEGK